MINGTDIDAALATLTHEDVVSFDNELLNGEGISYYENSQVLDAVVYRNHLSGRVGNFLEVHHVRIVSHGRELTCHCTCRSRKNICVHSMALLYAWANDGQDFTNLSDVLAQIHDWDSVRLREIVINILQKQPHLAGDFLKKHIPDWDEIDPDPFK
ncbi:MAG: SWIM zinc finger family protein [candidate division KSB1 bacterium]|nr:SWIM zinc finger family protein [candidate division KSB1 bacterium]MDZ7372127.1 SWIM zinc finger family protein [candidate division KSB1 bacterium]